MSYQLAKTPLPEKFDLDISLPKKPIIGLSVSEPNIIAKPPIYGPISTGNKYLMKQKDQMKQKIQIPIKSVFEKKEGKPVQEFLQGVTSASASVGQVIDNIVPEIQTVNTVGVDNKTKNTIYIVVGGLVILAASIFFKRKK